MTGGCRSTVRQVKHGAAAPAQRRAPALERPTHLPERNSGLLCAVEPAHFRLLRD